MGTQNTTNGHAVPELRQLLGPDGSPVRRARPTGDTGRTAAEDEGSDLGETRRVRRLRRRVAEAEQLHELRARQAEQAESAALDPAAVARTNRRWTAWTYRALGVGLALGAAISAGTVQNTITEALGWTADTVMWWLAYLAEPAVALILVPGLALRARAGAVGATIPDRSARMLTAVEVALIAVIGALTVGPALGVPDGVLVAVVHALGPVAVTACAASVAAVGPAVQAIRQATHRGGAEGATGRPYAPYVQGKRTEPGGGATGATAGPTPPQWVAGLDQARAAIRAGELDPEPSATALRRRLGVSTDGARWIRDELAAGGGGAS